MKKTIRVAIAEDHKIVRQGLISLLNNSENIAVVLDVGNGRELLENVERSGPDVVLLDIDMPVMGGSEALNQLKKKHPEIMVIMMSMHYIEIYVRDFISRGASVFFLRTAILKN